MRKVPRYDVDRGVTAVSVEARALLAPILATMLRLNSNQRALLADKLSDAGNLAAGALVFGQFLPATFSPVLAVAGLSAWLVLIGWALVLRKELKR